MTSDFKYIPTVIDQSGVGRAGGKVLKGIAAGNSVAGERLSVGGEDTSGLTEDIGELTEELLALARSFDPDLDRVALLLRQRELALERLPPADPAEREDRLSVLQRVRMADAEIRSYFLVRQAQVRDELRQLMTRSRPRAPRQQSAVLSDQFA